MSDIYGKGPRGKATRLHSLVVRARGRCEASGLGFGDCKGALECAHILSRSYANTRTDERNAWALCKKHHFHLTGNPHEHMRLVELTIGMAAFEELWERARTPHAWKQHEWQAEVDRLTALLREAA